MSSGSTQRVFIALDLPRGVREALAGWAKGAELGGGARLLAPGKLHLTLCFLGEREEAEVERAAAVMAGVARPLGRVETGAPVWLPKRRPRVLAVEAREESGGLERLWEEFGAALAEAIGWERPRGFRPHVTLARFGRGAEPRRGALPPTPALGFEPESISLYRSQLGPEGASYEAIATVRLRREPG